LGAALGAIGLTLVATGLVVAPGLRVPAAGPLLAALQGALAGLGAGGAAGALAGLGFWEEGSHLTADDVHGGSVLVGVHAEGTRLEQVRKLFRKTGASRVTG
jgi:hypothetical protein